MNIDYLLTKFATARNKQSSMVSPDTISEQAPVGSLQWIHPSLPGTRITGDKDNQVMESYQVDPYLAGLGVGGLVAGGGLPLVTKGVGNTLYGAGGLMNNIAEATRYLRSPINPNAFSGAGSGYRNPLRSPFPTLAQLAAPGNNPDLVLRAASRVYPELRVGGMSGSDIVRTSVSPGGTAPPVPDPLTAPDRDAQKYRDYVSTGGLTAYPGTARSAEVMAQPDQSKPPASKTPQAILDYSLVNTGARSRPSLDFFSPYTYTRPGSFDPGALTAAGNLHPAYSGTTFGAGSSFRPAEYARAATGAVGNTLMSAGNAVSRIPAPQTMTGRAALGTAAGLLAVPAYSRLMGYRGALPYSQTPIQPLPKEQKEKQQQGSSQRQRTAAR